MLNELDRRFDEELAKVVGPGGRLVLGQDELGRAIVTNFPATLPAFFKTFSALNGANEAVVAGEERLTFSDLDRISDRLALGLAARGIGKGDRVAIAMRNCPVWIVSYMAILKAGGIAALLNGWWEPLTFTVPDDLRGRRWDIACDSFDPARKITVVQELTVGPRSAVVLQSS